MPSGFNIEANVSLNSASLNASAKEVKQALGRITGQASEFQKSLDASTARVFAFGATTAVLNGVTQSFKKLISVTIEVEKRLVEINSIFQATDATFNKFRNSIFRVAKETGQAFNTVAEGAAELARQGLSAEATAERLKAALVLTRISGLDAEKSVKALTAAINGFASAGLTANQIVNKMVAVDTAFAVSAQDLAEAFSRAGSTAEDAGVSFNELLGLVTAVEQRTARGGAVIGNAFKSIFTRLARGNTIDQLKALGVQIDATQTGVQKLSALSAALERISDPTIASEIKELAGGVFQINVVSAALKDLSSDTSIFASAAKTASQATNEAFEKNAALNKTISAQINTLIVGLTSLAEKMGTITFGPLLENLIGLATTFTEFLDKALDPEKGNVFIKGLFKTIGQFLGGPALVIFTAAFVKIFGLVAKFAKDGLKSIFLIGSETQKIQGIEAGLIGLLQKDENLRKIIASTTATQAQKEQAVIQAIQRENALLTQQAQIMRQLATMAAQRGVTGMTATGGFQGKRGKMFASGFKQEEAMAKALGAKNPRAKRISAQINGRQQNIIANTEEIIARGVGRNGDDAIIPTYARGYVPNFAKLSASAATRMIMGGKNPQGWKARKDLPADVRARAEANIAAGTSQAARRTVTAKEALEVPYPDPITIHGGSKAGGVMVPSGGRRWTGAMSGTYERGNFPIKWQVGGKGFQVFSPKLDKKHIAKVTKRLVDRGSVIEPQRIVDRVMEMAAQIGNDYGELLSVPEGVANQTTPEGIKAGLKKGGKNKGGWGAIRGLAGATFESAIYAAMGLTEYKIDRTRGDFDILREHMSERPAGPLLKKLFDMPAKYMRGDLKVGVTPDTINSFAGKVAKKDFATQEADYIDQLIAARDADPNYTGKKSKRPKRMATGYVPNFAGGLAAAIEREKNAGVPVSKIRAHFAGGYPIAVTNTAHEPNGLKDVMTAGGYVPNFAVSGNLMMLSFILPDIINTWIASRQKEIAMAQAKTDADLEAAEEALEVAQSMGKATDQIERVIAQLKKTQVEQKTQMEESGKIGGMDINTGISGAMLALMAAPMLKKFKPVAALATRFAGAGSAAAGGISRAGGALGRFAFKPRGVRVPSPPPVMGALERRANPAAYLRNQQQVRAFRQQQAGRGRVVGNTRAPQGSRIRNLMRPASAMGRLAVGGGTLLGLGTALNDLRLSIFGGERGRDEAFFFNALGGEDMASKLFNMETEQGFQYTSGQFNPLNLISAFRQGRKGGQRSSKGLTRDRLVEELAGNILGVEERPMTPMLADHPVLGDNIQQVIDRLKKERAQLEAELHRVNIRAGGEFIPRDKRRAGQGAYTIEDFHKAPEIKKRIRGVDSQLARFQRANDQLPSSLSNPLGLPIQMRTGDVYRGMSVGVAYGGVEERLAKQQDLDGDGRIDPQERSFRFDDIDVDLTRKAISKKRAELIEQQKAIKGRDQDASNERKALQKRINASNRLTEIWESLAKAGGIDAETSNKLRDAFNEANIEMNQFAAGTKDASDEFKVIQQKMKEAADLFVKAAQPLRDTLSKLAPAADKFKNDMDILRALRIPSGPQAGMADTTRQLYGQSADVFQLSKNKTATRAAVEDMRAKAATPQGLSEDDATLFDRLKKASETAGIKFKEGVQKAAVFFKNTLTDLQEKEKVAREARVKIEQDFFNKLTSNATESVREGAVDFDSIGADLRDLADQILSFRMGDDAESIGDLINAITNDEQFKRLDAQDGIMGNLLKDFLAQFGVDIERFTQVMNEVRSQSQGDATGDEGRLLKFLSDDQAKKAEGGAFEENEKLISDLGRRIEKTKEHIEKFNKQFEDDPEAMEIINNVNNLNTMLVNAANGLAPLANMGGGEGEGGEINLSEHLANLNESVGSMIIDSNKQALKSAEALAAYEATMDVLVQQMNDLRNNVRQHLGVMEQQPPKADNSQGNAKAPPASTPAPAREFNTCFVAGTKVTMADKTYKNVEDVKKGDRILSYNVSTKQFGVDRVVAIPDLIGNYKKIIANYEDGTKNEFSPAHPFYIDGKGWSSYDLKDKIIVNGDCGDGRQENEWNIMFKNGNLHQLEVGDYCINNKGEKLKITSLEETNEYVDMYNLEYLSNNKNWFANGVLVKE